MLSMILGWLGNLLGGPFAKAAVDAYKAKLTAENTTEKVAADLAGRELAVQQRELELQTQLRIAEIGKWYEPDHLAAYVFVAYFTKVVVYDVMLGLGSTPALHGSIADWMGLIAMFLFGKRGIENVARIIKR
jgi:hypothetical protein